MCWQDEFGQPLWKFALSACLVVFFYFSNIQCVLVKIQCTNAALLYNAQAA